MKRTIALLLSALVLLPGVLSAFYSIAEMNAAALRKDPSIKIIKYESGDEVTFVVALQRSENQEVYSHGSIDIVDKDGAVLGRVSMRGEDIRRAVQDESLRAWGWQDFRPAEVFQFTVHSRMLTQSKFTRETGPRNDEHGVAYGGGIIRWSYLKELADAAQKVDKVSAASGTAR